VRRPLFFGVPLPGEDPVEFMKRALSEIERWSYEDEASGLTLLTSGSFTAAATLDLTQDLSIYRRLELHINGIRPATDATTLRLYFSNDAGSAWTAGNITTGFVQVTSGTTVTGDANTAAAVDYVQLGTATIGNAAGEGYWGIVTLGNFNVAGQKPIHASGLIVDPATAVVTETVVAYDQASLAMNALRLQFSSGNIAAVGTYDLYGIRQDNAL
jgi:hypothetical protein